MGALQPLHWLVILLVIFLLIGPRRIWNTGRALGESWRALIAGWREGSRPLSDSRAAPTALPARPCDRCGVWSGDMAAYCTSCGAALPT